jgi:Uncharacterized protein conserved in bacteria
MQIEYDPTKNDKNIRERGLSFEMVEHFDFETAVLWLDVRKTYPEVRISALGILAGRVYSLVFAETAKGIRVISFRKANNREVKRYEQKNQR